VIVNQDLDTMILNIGLTKTYNTMRHTITNIFNLLLALSIILTIIVFMTWLFDFKPTNLYFVWYTLLKSLTVSFLFLIIFGEK
jgi:hypothetical protein